MKKLTVYKYRCRMCGCVFIHSSYSLSDHLEGEKFLFNAIHKTDDWHPHLPMKVVHNCLGDKGGTDCPVGFVRHGIADLIGCDSESN